MALHVVIAGEKASGPPLVLLHGLGGGAYQWRPVIEALTGQAPVARPILAYDLPGHGRSIGAEGVGGAGRMAKAILADLDAREISRFHIAGHSLGGAIAALLALKQPTRVASVLLIAPGGFGPAINHRALARYVFAENEAELGRALEAMTGFNFRMPEEVLAHMLEDRARSGAMAALSAMFPAMFTGPVADVRQQGVLPVGDLARLAMPIRLLWGDQDCILPVTQSEDLPANIAVQRVSGAGHMLVEECPGAVVDGIRANLSAAG